MSTDPSSGQMERIVSMFIRSAAALGGWFGFHAAPIIGEPHSAWSSKRETPCCRCIWKCAETLAFSAWVTGGEEVRSVDQLGHIGRVPNTHSLVTRRDGPVHVAHPPFRPGDEEMLGHWDRPCMVGIHPKKV